MSDLCMLEVILDINLVFETQSSLAISLIIRVSCTITASFNNLFNEDGQAIRFEEEILVRFLAEQVLTEHFQYFTSVEEELAT